MRSIVAFLVVVVLAVPVLSQPLRGTVERHSFVDQGSGRTVEYNIYLPEGYASSGERYPVVYHLHGLGGTQDGTYNTTVPRSFEAAQDEGVIGPVIVVFANGYQDSWWADSATSAKPAETDVASRLVPYVDANYRTIARRGARVVQGFSMGGFGAVKFYAKFADLFSVCVEYDGAFYDWSIFRLLFSGTAAEVFGGSGSYFNMFSPWSQTDLNAPRLRGEHPIRMVVGILTSANRGMRDHLTARSIPVDYVETACGHDLECLLDAQGRATAAFIAARLELFCPGDFNRDGVVNSQDFFEFLGVFFGGGAGADFNADGVVNSQDVFDFLGAFFGGC